MKTRTLVVAAVILALLPGLAAAQKIGGGVKGGVTFGDIPEVTGQFDDEGVDTSQRIGFVAGGFLTFNFGGGFMLQPEVLYTQKGVKLDTRVDEFGSNFKIRVDYLEVPVLARLTFGKVLRGYVFGGPSMNFRMSAKSEIDVLGEKEEEDISEDVERFEFAVVFGGGIEIGPVLFEGRWSEGLTDIAIVEAGDPAADLKTRTMMFLLGLRF